MTSAGAGVAVHLDGFTAAGLAAHRALTAAGAGARRAGDGVRGDAPRRRRVRGRAVGGRSGRCRSALVHRLLGDRRAHRRGGGRERDRGRGAGARRASRCRPPIHVPGVRGEPRAAGARLGPRGAGGARAATRPARRWRCWSIPAELDAADFVAGHRRRGARAAHHRRGRVGRRVGVSRVLEGGGAGGRVRGAGLLAASCTRAWG